MHTTPGSVVVMWESAGACEGEVQVAHHHLLVEARCDSLTVSAYELGNPEPMDVVSFPAIPGSDPGLSQE